MLAALADLMHRIGSPSLTIGPWRSLHRDTNHAVTFLTGHDRSGDVPTGIDWPAVARSSPVIVLYMALRHLREIGQHLIAAGRPSDEPVSIETTLGSMGDTNILDVTTAPAIVCVGEVVRLPSMPEWTAGS